MRREETAGDGMTGAKVSSPESAGTQAVFWAVCVKNLTSSLPESYKTAFGNGKNLSSEAKRQWI